MISLPSLRKRIDRIDQQLLRWLNRRAHLALQVGQLKQAQRRPVFDPRRESAILRRVTAANRGPLSARAVRRIFQEILTHSRLLEAAKSAHKK